MALFEFTDKDGQSFKANLSLAKAVQMADDQGLKFEMIHGGTSGHGIPGEDF